jgi:hypothetical protein
VVEGRDVLWGIQRLATTKKQNMVMLLWQRVQPSRAVSCEVTEVRVRDSAVCYRYGASRSSRRRRGSVRRREESIEVLV